MFAQSLDDPEKVWKALAAVALFSLVASGVYFLNDACDARRDREHPARRNRPVAIGSIGRVAAGAGGIAVMIAATALALLLSPELAVVLGAYAGLNIVYSFYLKRFALVDIMVISAGFVLRAIAGAVAIDVTISVWLLVCTFFVALLMAAGKRRVELATAGAAPAATRPSLDQASVGFFDAVTAGAGGGDHGFLHSVYGRPRDRRKIWRPGADPHHALRGLRRVALRADDPFRAAGGESGDRPPAESGSAGSGARLGSGGAGDNYGFGADLGGFVE